MATMWFAKDGKRPNSQSGPGISITSQEAQAVIGSYQAIFVGKEAPNINPEQPSYSPKNVVFEVELDTETNLLLPQVGFYVVAGLTPENAQLLLNAHRGLT